MVSLVEQGIVAAVIMICRRVIRAQEIVMAVPPLH
jgi:hypothetical protein